jgi:hypothetical protein
MQPIKRKRGRKSKKELIESLNNITIHVDEPVNETIHSLTLKPILEPVVNFENLFNEIDEKNEINKINTLDKDQDQEQSQDQDQDQDQDQEQDQDDITKPFISSEEPKALSKKRGRKPKGGKIVQNILASDSSDGNLIEDKPNVILHLKCSIKDLVANANNDKIESYNFDEVNYDIINPSMIDSNDENEENDNNNDNDNTDMICATTSKEIWKKLKQLENNLHHNHISKRAACFWDTYDFDNPPVYIPKYVLNGVYHVYGCFCSLECAVAYLMNESIDTSTKFERYHLFNHIYSKVYNYSKSVKPAPDPYYMLSKFYGNLSIQDYRMLLGNERLYLIIDKPLTRILPELHEHNDDYIINSKIIPSNYQVKSKLLKKKDQEKDTNVVPFSCGDPLL